MNENYIHPRRPKGLKDSEIMKGGYLFKKKRNPNVRILDSGLTRIRFSLDAFRPETYAKVRVGSIHLDRVIKNIETFLFYWSWGFFPKKTPPRPIFVFENTRVPPLDLKKYFFSNRLKSFCYQSHWIAFGLTIPKWYNTWVLKIFLNIFLKKYFEKYLKNIFEKNIYKNISKT